MKATIGLEVHVELKTESKMFCGCSTDYFGKDPNTYTCPVCLGLPGALPVPNKTAIEWCVMLGIALNCQIPLFSKFDRKNYFYPDLPKGYQISQYDQPFCVNGSIEINGKKIRIRRVHMEEDTGKLIHEADSSLIDFNRSGIPLIEIVTEPDFETPEDVKIYLQKLQQIVRYLSISDADMEKGQMRLEPNVSILPINTNTTNKYQYKVEVKNINSFRFVEKAINYEIQRQLNLINSGKTPIQETRGWDEKKQITITQRIKEEESDYRYFPEPDIPPIRWVNNQITNIKLQIPELPDQKQERFKKRYGLNDYTSELLTKTKETADYFEEAVKVGRREKVNVQQIANYIINRRVNILEILPAKLIQNIIVSAQKVTIDEEELEKIIDEVLRVNEKAVSDYKKGKKEAIMFLVGQTLRKLNKKINAEAVKEKIREKIK